MKFRCEERRCGWHGEEVLTAPNPFDPADTINGCPSCRAVDTIELACDEPDCWEPVSCGTPTDSGYRNTCGPHLPNVVRCTQRRSHDQARTAKDGG